MVLVEKNPHLLRLSANPALSTDDKVRVHVDREVTGVNGGLDALMELMKTILQSY